MSFNKRTWVDRSSEYPNRRKLIDEAGIEKTYTVERYEGEISAEGDDWSATNMNDLENRIADGIDGTAASLAVAEDGANSEHAYSVGSFLSHKGVLYEVVASIAKGDKLDTVTNIKQVTVGQMLEHLVANQKNFVFAYDAASGRYGYSIDGVFRPFRNPTGNAVPADVLAGKTFSSAGLDDATGTMPNHGTLNVTLKPDGNNATSQSVAAGYYSGGTIKADGTSSYSSGYTNGKNDGYNSGLASGSGGSDVTISFPHPGHYLLALRGNTYVFYPGGGGSMGISASGLSINQVTSMAAPNNGGQINVYHVNVTSSSGSVSFTRTGNTSVSWWYV